MPKGPGAKTAPVEAIRTSVVERKLAEIIYTLESEHKVKQICFKKTDSFKLGQKGKSALQDQESELNGKWIPFQDDSFLYKLGSCLSMKGFFP